MEYTVLILWTVTNMSNSRSLHAVFVNEFSAFLLINYWLVVTEGQLAKFLELGFQAQDYFIRNLSRGVCELAGKGSLNELYPRLLRLSKCTCTDLKTRTGWCIRFA